MAKLIGEILRLLESLTTTDLEAMAPAERQRLAQLLRHWAKLASPPAKGILDDLDKGDRGD